MTALVLLLLALHQLLGRSYSFFFLFYAPQLRVDGQEKLSFILTVFSLSLCK
jgi:hypothetical protein